MNKLKMSLLILITISLSYLIQVRAQSSAIPTTASGTNVISYNDTDKKFYFLYNDNPLYSYFVGTNGALNKNGGTLNGVQAKAIDGVWFWPSNAGGITAFLGGKDRAPWDANITYALLDDPKIEDNVLKVDWRMNYNLGTTSDYLDYTYKLQISGKTLIITVEVLNNSTKATGINFDRCENAYNKNVVIVPFLNLFNLLYSNDCYTSLFVDWEFTNSSTIYPLDPWEYNVPDLVSKNSARYTQHISYKKKTNGLRNPLKEKIYLTVSSNIDEVLPNLPGPIAPLRNVAASKTILSYGPPYPWLFWPNPDYKYRYLDSLKNRGVKDLNVIIKQYQFYGFDRKLPDVLKNGQPADFEFYTCDNIKAGGQGSREHLIALRNHIVNDLGYGFALHEQYVDVYKNSPSYLATMEAKNSPDNGGGVVRNWVNCEPETAHVFKPYYSPSVAKLWSSKLKDFLPTWSYLDVHSAANPSNFVDYEYTADGAGYFKYVLNQYRSIPAILKSNYGVDAPVQGEGGKGLMLYAGYFDDLEARLLTANYNIYGYYAPLFINFAVEKIKPKSSLHGLGHCGSFFAECLEKGCEDKHVSLSRDELLIYIATELAYGNSGLITKGNVLDHSIEQAVLETSHVLPLAKAIINAKILSIEYGDSLLTASEYIKRHSNFADIKNKTDFMGKIKVTYDNGIVVFVNRHPTESWIINVGSPNKWFSYHAFINGSEQLFSGKSNNTQYTLPSKNGWVVYYPMNNN
jgi:hypothetical protein